ncbi:hypothetical protein K466DRAFT_389937 [Polyporus arcularius HHB13444]|uniref:Uncharacterized protein n=1 Tax=Polyporus arcularius HHB13444 TaxID=1314778 RepID=A0A5C3PM06_9APHY|nr:hypothetical protein K466DRAFT_389937 [Polyporus arcularius HHB13444]
MRQDMCFPARVPPRRHPTSTRLPRSVRICVFSAFAISRSSSLSRNPEIPVLVPRSSRRSPRAFSAFELLEALDHYLRCLV